MTTGYYKKKRNTRGNKGISQSYNPNSGLVQMITNVVSSVGIPGALVVFGIFFITTFSTSAQKAEIIDKWVLFKNNSNSQAVTISVIIFAVVIYILEAIAFYKIRQLDREEIRRLSGYKREEQEESLGLSLSTSN